MACDRLFRQLRDLERLIDLLYHLPTGAIERICAPAASAQLLGRNIILDLTPFDTRESRSGRGPSRIFATDSDGNAISLVYFNNPGWAKRQLPNGEKRIISGKLLLETRASALPRRPTHWAVRSRRSATARITTR